MSSPIEMILEQVKGALNDIERTQNISAKVGFDRDAGVIRIYAEGSDNFSRARSGLAEVLELAYATAEHHPYWSILYHANEISRTLLDNWQSDLTPDQISEMTWRCDEIRMVLDRLAGK